jgi:hypothetical protein
MEVGKMMKTVPEWKLALDIYIYNFMKLKDFTPY